MDGAAYADASAEATEIATTSGTYLLDLTAAEMNGATIALIVKTTSAGAKTTPMVLYPRVPITLESGTLTAGTTASATLTTAAATLNSYYNGCVIHITSGDGSGQGRMVTAYTGASRIAVVTPVFASAPSSTSAYSLYVTDYAANAIGWVGTRVVQPTTAGTPLVDAGNTVSANVVVMAANTLTASALASDAAREVATDVGVVMTTNAVLSVTNTVSANIVAMNTNTVTATALASDAAREIALDAWVVGSTAAVGTATNVLAVGPTAVTVTSFAAAAIDAAAIAANAIGASELAADAAAEIADAILGRNVEGGSSSGRTVAQAFARIRNRVAVVTTTMTVFDVTDTAASWTALVTTAAGNPIIEIDPA